MSIKDATWITGKAGAASLVFRKRLTLESIDSALIDICGLGLFNLYVNGKRVGESLFEPAPTTYDEYSSGGVFDSPRIYYCRHDLTAHLHSGENLISVELGNGFYEIFMKMIHGSDEVIPQLLIFSLTVKDKNGVTQEIKSDSSVLVGYGNVVYNEFHRGEIHDMNLLKAYHDPVFDEVGFTFAQNATPPIGELTLFTYPNDKVIREITPEFIGYSGDKRIYDFHENISGRVCVNTLNGCFDEVVIEHAEEIRDDMSLDLCTAGWGSFSESGNESQVQCFVIKCDGKAHYNVSPKFTWQAFRYVSVRGNAEISKCQVIHTDIKKTAEFRCGNELINKILDMYVRTQLDNIHGCIPSDCPHRERYGYTGDGQITCETVMTVFDAKEMYRKWMRDIVDCRDKNSGHIQHTAPFVEAGGGPSGWGGAVAVIPYTYYKVYGDRYLTDKYITHIKHYLDYMESRCENGLVVREEEGWCLGDWCYEGCEPFDDIPFTRDYVNTCYLVKFYALLLDISDELSLNIDRLKYTERIEKHKTAIVNSYFDEKTGDFCQNLFAANAFAIDIGLGDKRTLDNLVRKYEIEDGFDTGIFGTEILIRILCENGYKKLAYKLLTSNKEEHSFAYMIKKGATTIWEEWNGKHSHNHPMFGGCIKTLWNAFLGIKIIGAGYKEISVEPCDIKEIGNMTGSLLSPMGRITVELKREQEYVIITVNVPEGVNGNFKFRNTEATLHYGLNRFTISN